MKIRYFFLTLLLLAIIWNAMNFVQILSIFSGMENRIALKTNDNILYKKYMWRMAMNLNTIGVLAYLGIKFYRGEK